MTRDSLYITLREKQEELKGISPKLSHYQKLEREIAEIKERLGGQGESSVSVHNQDTRKGKVKYFVDRKLRDPYL